MRNIMISLILFICIFSIIGVILIGCPATAQDEDGLIIVKLTNGDATAETHKLYFLIYDDGDTKGSSNYVAKGSDTITSGKALSIAEETADVEFSATGGQSYDLSAFVDIDNSGASGPNTGDTVVEENGFEVNGDTVVSLSYTDFQTQ